ncbi:uncharacterized protein LOC111371958 [Olea europaea var. sylvestris]|uniref:uncharacterized protein LOC111371958 n=1 Tax=Olea europaea var. sylvestris TaxID=158386 RepID=UPI000C1D3EDC|nr:uncharacterized protein LOC111371958 [Olea europaea var. sylvestris]
MDDLIFDHETYSEYMDDQNNSQGFYVTTSDNGHKLLGGIRRISKNQDHLYLRAEIAAVYAVEQHNKKELERTLKFLKFVNLNIGPTAGVIYYITLAAEDSSGEINHYQAKIWEKLNTGYQVQIFRLAPYDAAAKSSEESVEDGCCRIRVDNLQPGMDENYLFHKCFYRAREEILSVKVIQNEETGHSKAYGVVSFKNHATAEEFLMKYNEKLMPHTNDQKVSVSACLMSGELVDVGESSFVRIFGQDVESCYYYVYFVYCEIYLYIGNNYNNQDSLIFFSDTTEEGKGEVEGFKVPEL